MESISETPKPKSEEEKDYFSMSYEEVQELSPDELAQAAAESNISVERFLSLKKRASENYIDDFTPSKSITEAKEPLDNDLRKMLRMMSELGVPDLVSTDEVDRAEASEREGYALLETIKREMHGGKINSINNKATKLFVEALRTQFIHECSNLIAEGVEPEEAFTKILELYGQKGGWGNDDNIPYELKNAYRKIANEVKSRTKLEESRIAILEGTETPEQLAQWDRLRRVAYRGLNGNRITENMLYEAGIRDEYECTVPELLLDLAKKVGVSSGHFAYDSTGSAEIFSTTSPDAYFPQKRKHKLNDGGDF